MKITELIISALVLVTAVLTVSALGTPSFIHYQGVLEKNGSPAPNGTYTVIFRIWDADVNGDSIWGETHQITTKGNNGKFNVQLGLIEDLATEIFESADRWVGIEVYPDGEMTPRSQLGSVPFAFFAQTVADTAIDSTKIARNSIKGDNIKDHAIGKDKLDTLAVGKGKIEDRAVGKNQLDTLAVGKGKIEDKAVGKNQLDTLAVGKGKIEDKAVGKNQLDTLAVSKGKIEDKAVGNKQLDTLAVDKGKIEDKAVGKDQLDTLAVDEGRIKNSAVTTEKIADRTIQFIDIDTNDAVTGDVMKWDGSDWVASPDEVGDTDNDWSLSGNVLTTYDEWGIARAGSTLYGDHDSTHVNFGVQSITGDQFSLHTKYATVSGGIENEAIGDNSTVGGGARNQAQSQNAIIGGGENNSVDGSGWSGTIAGGTSNVVSGDYATVGGGYDNAANGTNSTVGGGGKNVANGQFSVVSGGGGMDISDANEATGDYSVAAGGRANRSGQEPTDMYTVVSGGRDNIATGTGATVGGGEMNVAQGNATTISGGYNNSAQQQSATVGGGENNMAIDSKATVAGGEDNRAGGPNSTVSGGQGNDAEGNASSIGGGTSNMADGDFSTVPGGWQNAAIRNYTFAAGVGAKANHEGSVVIAAHVWQYDTGVLDSVRTGGGSQMVLRADSLFYLTNMGEQAPPNTPGGPNSKFLDTSTGAFLTKSGSWQNSSSAALKENFASLDGEDILRRLQELRITRWNYKVDGESVDHIGPTAEDFFAAFGLGGDDRTISTIDPSGVALAALKQLIADSQEKEARIQELEKELSEMRAIVQKLQEEQH